MIKTKLHMDRLRVLAKHLTSQEKTSRFTKINTMSFDNGNFVYFYENGTFLIHPSVEMHLESLYPKFFWANHIGNMIYVSDPTTSISFVLGYFFGLNAEECLNLFMTGRQKPDIYGSKILTGQSGPKDIAYNIKKFLKSVDKIPMVDENVLYRRVLLEKISKNHPDNIFKILEEL